MMMMSRYREHPFHYAQSRWIHNTNLCILIVSVVLLSSPFLCSAFQPRCVPYCLSLVSTSRRIAHHHNDRLVALQAESPTSSSSSSPSESKPKRKSNSTTKKFITLSDLSQQVLSNPARFKVVGDGKNNKSSKSKSKSSYKRTRQRVTNPQQTYLYKAQRERLQRQERNGTVAAANNTEDDTTLRTSYAQASRELAQELGMVVSSQHCSSDAHVQPELIGRILISDSSDDTDSTEPFSARNAYILNKPPGWAILGSGSGGSSSSSRSGSPEKDQTDEEMQQEVASRASRSSKNRIKKITIVEEENGSTDVLEYNEMDVMALLSPEELEEYFLEEELDNPDEITVQLRSLTQEEDDTQHENEDDEEEEGEIDPIRRANLQRIAARNQHTSNKAKFASVPRPSIVSWLKDYWDMRQQPIRGGTYWTAIAGATHVDDSGLIVLVPRHKVGQIQIESSTVVAVVGTGGSLAKISKQQQSSTDIFEYILLSRLRKGRSDDPVQVVQINSTKSQLTTCSSVIPACQTKFQQGIRGDPEANPLDRRAPRRLLHCTKLVVSSQSSKVQEWECNTLPLDMAVLVERATHITGQKLFVHGSFVGRASFKRNSATVTTSAYREINGAADGYPGWIVDRYDKWLLVQHDPAKTAETLGPLPSIHDGYTAGVYILEQSNPDRSTSTDGPLRPRLLEGQPAPERFTVTENGITYLVSFQDMSTGIFLDQRSHRAWLARHCCSETRVLNCFAHAGAFSVAAATTGATTVSIDLSRKWLERLPDQLKANGIDFDERHDAIYGDCFDWLARLSIRGEKYDVVILDPPSTSVGGLKKKRWSIKNDMDELVALAAGLVKKGGVLWTTTNSASVPPLQFARLCKKGLDSAGVVDYKLERIQPMPGDFPSIGPQPVKNYVWRILR